MSTTTKSLVAFFVLFALLPLSVNAHLIGGNGISSGISHPFIGLDHLLAMIAVGIMAVRAGGKAVFGLPMTFVSFMALGGAIAVLGFPLPGVEAWIAISLLVFGIMVALTKKLPMNLAFACVAIFALFHGHAHGEEIPAIASPALYALGFVISTTMLHLTGAFTAYYAQRTVFAQKIFTAAGAAISIVGLFLLAGVI
jgi:urease accessory protein